MFQVIDLDDKCKITFVHMPVLLRSYHFEYKSFTITHKITFVIKFVSVDFKNYFKVESFIGEDKYFESYNEAEAYVFKEFNLLRDKLRDEEDRILTSISTYNANNKRGRRKKNEKKDKQIDVGTNS